MTRKEDRLPELLDLSKPGAIGVPLALASAINMAAFSPEGDRVAAVGDDQHGHIWNAHTGQALTPPFKHGGSLYWIEWSPDGRRVLTAGLHGAVMVWDAATGEPAAARMDLSYEPPRVAHFSPDGRFVVARSDDQLVRVWDSATSEPVTPVLKHAGAVRAVMITKDNRLVTVSTPAVIRAWNLTETSLSPDVLEDYAKLVSCRRLNAQGVLLPLKPGELAELSRSLRARAPQLFE